MTGTDGEKITLSFDKKYIAFTLIAVIAVVLGLAIYNYMFLPGVDIAKKGASTLASVPAKISEKQLGDRLADESKQFLKEHRGPVFNIEELQPGSDVYGTPSGTVFEWKPEMYNIHRSGGRDNIPLYVEYKFIDAKNTPHHAVLQYDLGKWQVVQEK